MHNKRKDKRKGHHQPLTENIIENSIMPLVLVVVALLTFILQSKLVSLRNFHVIINTDCICNNNILLVLN